MKWKINKMKKGGEMIVAKCDIYSSHSPSPAATAATTFPNNPTDSSDCTNNTNSTNNTNNTVTLKPATLACSSSPKVFLSDSQLNQHQLQQKDRLMPTQVDNISAHSIDDTGLEDRRSSSKSFVEQI